MKYCIYCGKELNDDAVYCTSCGKKQVEEKIEIVEEKSDGLGFAIASLCLFWVPIFPIIFAIIALVRGTKTNRLATIVCASIAIILSLIACVLWIVILVVNISSMGPICHYDEFGNYVCYEW